MNKLKTATDVIVESNATGQDIADVLQDARWRSSPEHFDIVPEHGSTAEGISIVDFAFVCEAKGVRPPDVIRHEGHGSYLCVLHASPRLASARWGVRSPRGRR